MRKFIAITLPAVIGIAIGVVASNLCAGCAQLKAVETEARPAVLFVLKEAYACGGCTEEASLRREHSAIAEPGGRASVCAEAVSNRIEQLVIDGKVTEAQEYPPTEGSREAGAMRGANLHRLAQDVYDGVVERLEAKVIEDALAATNAVESVTEGE